MNLESKITFRSLKLSAPGITVLLSIIALIFILLAGIFFFLYSTHSKPEFARQTSGIIQAADDTVITVGGMIKSERKGSQASLYRKIYFSITPDTILKKTVITIPTKSGVPVTRTEAPGRIADLKPQTVLTLIKTQEDLFTNDHVQALEIDYETLIAPTKNELQK